MVFTFFLIFSNSFGFDLFINGDHHAIGFQGQYMDIEWYKASYGEIIFKEDQWTDLTMVMV